ncbi:MAG: aminotransferase class IV [Trueperaceae bacterium]
MDHGAPTYGIDLELVPASQASLPLTDLALRRGYGAFDFLRVEGGVPLFLDDHLARFERSADLLGLDQRPAPDRIRRHVHDLIRANGGGTFGLQLFLTGGDPLDGFAPGTPRLLTLVVAPPRYPDAAYHDGVALLTHRFQRDLPEAKTTNYFTGVRLAAAMRDANAMEVLFHDRDRLLEASRCNLVIVDPDGQYRTPARDVLPGVTCLNLERALQTTDTPLIRDDVTMEQALGAREAFLTSTTKGLMPVVRIGERAIGDGRPGPATARATELFTAHRDAWLERHRTPSVAE